MGASVSPAVPDSLEIHVNRPRPNVLEVPELFIAERPFAIEFVNDGKPVHVHISLDEPLAEILELETGNHFLPREETFRLPVRIRDGRRPVRGKLTVSIGYGSESRFIELRIVEPSEDDRVHVDEDLAEPSGRRPGPTLSSRIVGEIGLIAIAIIALVALLVGAAIVGTVTSPALGILVVALALVVVAGVYVFL